MVVHTRPGLMTGAITIARQPWGVQVHRDGGDYLKVVMCRQEPDMRPFRCGADGKPEKARVGATCLTLHYDRARRRIVRHREAVKAFGSPQLDRLAALVSDLLLFGSRTQARPVPPPVKRGAPPKASKDA